MVGEYGVFGVARDIWDHPVLGNCEEEPFTKREAWMWLLSAAAYKPQNVGRKGAVVPLERGEFCFSLRFLEKKWSWRPGRVERFLNMLEKHDMIRDTERDGVKVYSINNYNKYQVVGIPKRDNKREADATTPRRHRDDTATKIEQSNNQEGKKEEGKSRGAVAPLIVPEWVPSECWQAFVQMRFKIKKPLTDYAALRAISKLEAFKNEGHDVRIILDNAVMNCWQDLWPPKHLNGTGPPANKAVDTLVQKWREEAQSGDKH